MVVTLPIGTIKRILDRVSSLPEQASEFILGEALARVIHADVETNSPTQTTKPRPKLPENIVSALEKARDDKTRALGQGEENIGTEEGRMRRLLLNGCLCALAVIS